MYSLINKTFLITFSIFLVLFNIDIISGISFYHNSVKTQCFDKYFYKGENITMTYIVSGENESNYRVYVKDKSTETDIYIQDSTSSGSFDYVIENEGKYELCFKPKVAIENSISFEFHSQDEAGHLIKIAKGENLSLMQKDILSIQSMFEQIEINIKYLTERYSKHSESKIHILMFFKFIYNIIIVINSFMYNLKYYSTIKVLLIIAVAVVQTFIIYKFINKKTNKITSSTSTSSRNFEF